MWNFAAGKALVAAARDGGARDLAVRPALALDVADRLPRAGHGQVPPAARQVAVRISADELGAAGHVGRDGQHEARQAGGVIDTNEKPSTP